MITEAYWALLTCGDWMMGRSSVGAPPSVVIRTAGTDGRNRLQGGTYTGGFLRFGF